MQFVTFFSLSSTEMEMGKYVSNDKVETYLEPIL